eukprot:289513_1
MATLLDWSLDNSTLRKKLFALSQPKLIKACKFKKVSHSGNKKEIIQRLIEANGKKPAIRQQLISWDISFKQKRSEYRSAAKKLYPTYQHWTQTVDNVCNFWKEELRITFSGLRNHSLRNRNYANLKITNKQLDTLLTKKEKKYQTTLNKLFASSRYFDKNISNIIIIYIGPLVYPIRYSIDLLPFFHSTVRDPREHIWNKAKLSKLKHKRIKYQISYKSQCNLIEEIFNEFVSNIRKEFNLRYEFAETAIFKVGSGNKMFTFGISGNYNNYWDEKHDQEKQCFTKLYLEELCKFNKCKKGQTTFNLALIGINYRFYKDLIVRSDDGYESRSRCWDGESKVLLADRKTSKLVKDINIGDSVSVLILQENYNYIHTANVTVKIETIIDREYEMVELDAGLFITPFHAVLNNKFEWVLPYQIGNITKRYQYNIFNFILDRGHILNINGVWTHTLGHDFKGSVIEHPIWGSSQVMKEMWEKCDGYPCVIENINHLF